VILAVLCTPFACESAQLIALRGTTSGTIESVGVRRGAHGTTAPQIEFSYIIDGRRYVSDQFSPGRFAGGTWTGGGRAARDYVAGQTVRVHYDPQHPSHACLAYGWHSWAIGLPLFLVGMGLQGWGGRRGGRRGRAAEIVGWTFAPLGIASLALIRDVLHPSQLPTAAALGAVAIAVSLLGRVLWERGTARVNKKFSGGPGRRAL
jgi:hypothetical protein